MTQAQAKTTTILEEQSLLDRILERVDMAVERRMAPAVQPMELRSFEELERWAERAARSDMVPRDYKGKPDNIILAVQMGSELGLRPMQSLQNIAVINGRPSVWGDAMLALCMTHSLYGGVEERIEGEGDEMRAVCVAQRKGDAAKIGAFSVADAKTAKLWQKRGSSGQDTPWITNPKRMLQMRARGFALRDAFPDKLRGLISAEEAADYEPISAAPPPVTREPLEDKARLGAEALAARFFAVVTAQDYYSILDEEKTATQMRWLRDKRPDLFAIVDSARETAAATMKMEPEKEETSDEA